MTINHCVQALQERDEFLILTHTRPDGDTLGSAGALCHALRRLGKAASLYPNPEITAHYAPFVEAFLGDGSGHVVVTVDIAGENLFPKGFTGRADICIDHHKDNPGFAPISVIDGDKASCGEIVLEIILALCGNITPDEANLLYLAVSTDCGCFCYGNTTAETFRAAAFLVEHGAEHHRLNKLLFRSFSYSRLRLEGLIYANLQSYRDNQINVALVTLEMMRQSGASEDDCDDLASLAGKVQGNRVAITVRELSPGKTRASVRTDGSVDAAAVCQTFGGGGHKMAAGCTADLPPETVASQLLAAVEGLWP